MTPVETLAFLSEGVGRATKGLELGTSTNNLELIALNVRQLFRCSLVRGLVLWRARRSPVTDVAAALNAVRDNVRTRPDLTDRVPVARACLLAALLDDEALIDVAPTTPEEYLDFALASRALKPVGAPESIVNESLRRLSSSERTSLAAESYSNYFEIVARGATGSELTELVSKGEALYALRAGDSYFAGGDQSEGGGPDNSMVLDYRLALALKVVGYRGSTISAWVWGNDAP